MANLNGFNASEVEPSVPFEPLPAADYLCSAVDSDVKQTKDGHGSFLEFKFEIIEGQYKGRTFFDRLNLDNPNEKAVAIARATLSALCRAVGVLTPKDSCELHNIPLIATIKLRKREDNGEMSNEVKGYKPRSAGSSSPSKPADDKKSNAAPWKK
jgi:hypothetical protein